MPSQRHAAQVARDRHIDGISYQALRRLEAGEVKNPEPEFLRALATLYGVSYADIVRKVVEYRFGVGSDDATKGPSSLRGATTNDAHTARVLELEQRIDEYETTLREIRDVASRLVKIAARGEKGRATRGHRPKRRERHRSAG